MTLGEHPIRVLVVEDSLITRRVVVNAITKAAGLPAHSVKSPPEVVGMGAGQATPWSAKCRIRPR